MLRSIFIIFFSGLLTIAVASEEEYNLGLVKLAVNSRLLKEKPCEVNVTNNLPPKLHFLQKLLKAQELFSRSNNVYGDLILSFKTKARCELTDECKRLLNTEYVLVYSDYQLNCNANRVTGRIQDMYDRDAESLDNAYPEWYFAYEMSNPAEKSIKEKVSEYLGLSKEQEPIKMCPRPEWHTSLSPGETNWIDIPEGSDAEVVFKTICK